jgi:hypothetical protein
MRKGSTEHLATIVASEPTSIDAVAQMLEEVRMYAADTSNLGEWDGIACFSLLYREITTTVGAEEFDDDAFLIRLDIEFARRYFAAIQRYAQDMESAPRCWRVLFDRRADPSVAPVQFAAAGVNAHINHDLAPALVATWQDFPPNEARRRDYDLVNAVFAEKMDRLREVFGTFLAQGVDGAPWDRFGNWAGDQIVRFTREQAWERAEGSDWQKDPADAVERLDRQTDLLASWLGVALMEVPLVLV